MSSATLVAANLPIGAVKLVHLDDEPVAVAHTEDGVFAIADTCSHAEVSLSEGELSGCLLECWLHGSAFDVRTGMPTSPPANRPVKTYAVTIEGEGDNAVYRVSEKESL